MRGTTDNSKNIGSIEITLQVIATKVGYIEGEVNKINARLEKEYVTQDQFEPVKNLVYGLVGLILITVVGAILALVIIK